MFPSEQYVELAHSGLPLEYTINRFQLIFSPYYSKKIETDSAVFLVSLDEAPLSKDSIKGFIEKIVAASCKQVVFVNCHVSRSSLLLCAENQVHILQLTSQRSPIYDHHSEPFSPEAAAILFTELRYNLTTMVENEKLSIQTLGNAFSQFTLRHCVVISSAEELLFDYAPETDITPLLGLVHDSEKQHLFPYSATPIVHLAQQYRQYSGRIITCGRGRIYVFMEESEEDLSEIKAIIEEFFLFFYLAVIPEIPVVRPPTNAAELVESIIFDGLNSPEDIRVYMNRFSMNPSALYFLWILDVKSLQGVFSDFEIQTFLNIAGKYNTNCTMFFRDNKIISVTENKFIPIDQVKSAFQGTLIELKKRFPEYRFALSFSRSYPSLCDMDDAYRDAIFGLNLNRHLNLLSDEDEIPFYNSLLLHHLVYDQLDNPILEKLYQNTILLILKYDEDNKDSLFSTVQTLLRHNFNYTDTAKELYIHRNTLYQRIARIESILGMSVSNTNTKTLLLLGMIIYEILKLEKEKVKL